MERRGRDDNVGSLDNLTNVSYALSGSSCGAYQFPQYFHYPFTATPFLSISNDPDQCELRTDTEKGTLSRNSSRILLLPLFRR
jgi:hypothetical protein